MLIYTDEREVLEKLNKAGYEAYFVGGCVRDSVLGRDYKDIDITTSATPEEVMKVFGEDNIIPTGIKHGTVTVMPYGVEVTTYRADGKYKDNRHPEKVKFVKTLKEDLSRRDFTINAMAMDKAGVVVDPFLGRDDLMKGLIRAVGNPNKRFKEDALRIMRAMRFAAVFGFDIEPKTAEAMHKHKELLKNISAERIYSELKGIFNGNYSAEVIRNNVEILGVVMPEILPMVGFEQNNPYHMYTVFEHTVQSISHISASHDNKIVCKMAMLFHDIGKPSTYTVDDDGVGHFYGHQEVSEKMTSEILDRLKADNDTKEKVLTLVKNHDIHLEATRRIIKRRLNQFGEELFFDLVAVRKADVLAQSNITIPSPKEFVEIIRIANDIIKEQECFSLKDLAINGNDLINIGVPEGKKIGQMLDYLLEEVIAERIENDKKSLLNIAEVAYELLFYR